MCNCVYLSQQTNQFIVTANLCCCDNSSGYDIDCDDKYLLHLRHQKAGLTTYKGHKARSRPGGDRDSDRGMTGQS